MKFSLFVFLVFVHCFGSAENAIVDGIIKGANNEPIPFVNAILIQLSDSTIYKVEITKEDGSFVFENVKEGKYHLEFRYLGYKNSSIKNIAVKASDVIHLGNTTLESNLIELQGATVSSTRSIIEMKPDRMVFNVEGTINSVGSNALDLLKKAPGVTLDNNDNVSVLGRTGVLIYVDGKKLPLGGADLSNYMENLTAEQIDRFDIITNPGSKYEAEGNAGIIDIRMKRNKNVGFNGSVSGTLAQGKYTRFGLNTGLNYKNKLFNIFSQLGYGIHNGFSHIFFESYQNGLFILETNTSYHHRLNPNGRIGLDYYLNKNSTIGLLVSLGNSEGTPDGYNQIILANESNKESVDSILEANTNSRIIGKQGTYNLSYRYNANNNRTLNIDLDYGKFNNTADRNQINQYLTPQSDRVLSESNRNFETPTNIQIYTFKLDYEQNLWAGKLGLGSKISKVVSKNSYFIFDKKGNEFFRNDTSSNYFEYNEMVNAGYINYDRDITEKWKGNLGIRMEQTDANGDLQAFIPDLQEPPVKLDYLSWFPHAGISFQLSDQHNFSLNYGRRINRPDYNVLNPFNNQLSQLSFEKGNPFLKPEKVNNIELAYNLNSRYSFMIGYSHTDDQITRLIGPDDVDPRASYINWDNLASQKIYSSSISAPFQPYKFWNTYTNLSLAYTDNQANYGEGATVNIQVFNYHVFQQHTFDLPWRIKGEISGFYSGPGVWGGVFLSDPNWGIDAGLQRKFLKEKLNVKVSGTDLTYDSGWSGISNFDGLISEGYGNGDSRRINLSITYQFGNQNLKLNRRKAGLEDEAGRIN